MNRKILFWAIGIMIIVNGFSFAGDALAITPYLSLDHFPVNPQANQKISFYLDIETTPSDGCGHTLIGVSPPPWNTLIINFGDGNSEEWGCVPGRVGRVYKCKASAQHSYSQPGIYTVSTRAKYAGSAAGCDEWIEVTDTITIVEEDCKPDGCNANCHNKCTIIEDPDCGCLNNDGCCGIRCSNKNDDDCPSMATSYDNPLSAEDIPQLVSQILEYFSKIIVYYLVPLLIIIGAYVIVTSGGSASKVSRGKKIIIWTLAGFVLILLANGLIALVQKLLGK